MNPEIEFREGLEELAEHYKQVLSLLGEDTDREGLQKTPMRVAKAMQVLTRGYAMDAHQVLTVGALNGEGKNAPFSSVGPTQDGRVKPDVVAIGSPATIVTGRGTVAQDMGTSFAAPIICGLTACLWQALPDKTALEIMELIRETGSNKDHPDNITGYGVPNFWRAYMIGNVDSGEWRVNNGK